SSPARGGGGARKRAGWGRYRPALSKPAPSTMLRMIPLPRTSCRGGIGLSRHHAGLAALNRKRFQRRDIGLRIVRIRDHAHLHLHERALEVDADITAPPALEEVHMRIVGQRLRDELVRRPV